MHGRNLQDLREGEFILEPEFRRLVYECLVAGHAIFVFHGEHAAMPPVVHVPAGVVAVAEGGGHVAAPGLTAQVVHDLIVGIQVSTVPVDDDGTLQLLEHTAHGQAVLGQVFLAHAVSVLVQFLVAFGATCQNGCGGREGKETVQYKSRIHIRADYLTIHTATRLDSGLREASRSPATEPDVIRLRSMPASTSMFTTTEARRAERTVLMRSLPVPLSA